MTNPHRQKHSQCTPEIHNSYDRFRQGGALPATESIEDQGFTSEKRVGKDNKCKKPALEEITMQLLKVTRHQQKNSEQKRQQPEGAVQSLYPSAQVLHGHVEHPEHFRHELLCNLIGV